ncbi:hypothetical protein FRACYDRAFT_250244 [Fragilariopsis cylindrus CCMP1102]|uniref:Uncharacterized protein n=1 Tax=Fragilariopsis cylindrus CCMP1102 TaxID=635003 RepID=A0A1E7EQ90_9STRA|nr:hypothetical protein FRACYDRAFT_250244 [Fragilariopsis cylindrus CCMP1102]|eukprot:OEU08024.1 hypothetical protein FRACYDRAFT_250244 [Fragilariopsis cylindrus CCMP1102]
MSINSSDTLTTGGLGKAVSSVFCDRLLADTAIKISKLHVENTALEPISKVLRTIKLYGITEERDDTIDVDISSYDVSEENNDFYVYKVKNAPSLSHERLGGISVVLSGIRLSQAVFMQQHYDTNEDNADTVESILGNGVVHVNWIVENYHESINEILQAYHYFSTVGLTNVDTGNFLESHGAACKFVGSTIKLDHIKIKKMVIDRAINTAQVLKEGEADDFTAQLKLLSVVFPDNQSLLQKAEEYEMTKLRNQQLVSSRDLFGTCICTNMDHVPLFQLKLKSGSSGTMQVGENDMIPCWDLRRESNSCPIRIPLSSISNLTFNLGNIPVYSTGNDGARGSASYGVQLLNGGYLRAFFFGKYQSIVSTVVFCLDESSNEFSEDVDINQRIEYSIMSDQRRIDQQVLGANGQQVERLPERVTVRFVVLQVNLQMIKSRLDLLKISIYNKDEETKEDTTENNDDNNELD